MNLLYTLSPFEWLDQFYENSNVYDGTQPISTAYFINHTLNLSMHVSSYPY
jgi:hypothetical protein